MKKFNFKILSVFLAIAIVVLGAAFVAPSGEEVSALPEYYDGSYVYYFCDYYPTLDYKTFHDTFDTSIYYDVRWVNKDQFNDLVHSMYFQEFTKRMIIFDIKTFMPDTDVLCELFSYLRDMECVTGFVTFFDESDFPDTDFFEYLDIFVDNAHFDAMGFFFRLRL